MSRCFGTTSMAFLWILLGVICSVVECCEHNVHNSSGGKIPLYIGAMFSVDSGLWDGSGCVIAADLALEQINNRSDILEDYELKMIWHDTQCDANEASRALFDLLGNEPEEIILLGPGCSVEAAVTAQVSRYWNLVTVLNSATSEVLSDRAKYPNVYRTTPRTILVSPFIWMLKNYGWRKVGHLFVTQDTFNEEEGQLSKTESELDVEIISEKFTSDGENQVDRFDNENIKIIFSTTWQTHMIKIFCKAYKRGLTGEDMFWIVPGWYSEKWWLTVNDDDIDCTKEEIAEAVESAMPVSLDVAVVSPLNKTTVSGLMPSGVLSDIEERLTWPRYEGFTMNNFVAYTFDAVWTIGLMLNKTARRLGDRGTRCLEDFTTLEHGLYKMFLNELAGTNFFGASGEVKFLDGERLGSSQISQLRGHCPPGWYLRSRFCYKFCDDVEVTWQEAVSACENDNAELVRVVTDGDYDTFGGLWRAIGDTNQTRWHVSFKNVEITEDSADSYIVDTNRTSNGSSGKQSMNCPYVDFQSDFPQSTLRGHCLDEKPFICRSKADFFNVQVAVYTSHTDEIIWLDRIIWPGGEVTKDGTAPEKPPATVDQREIILSALSHITLLAVSGCGLLLLLVCVIFILRIRSSPEETSGLDLLIIFSSLITFTSVNLVKSELLPSLTDGQHVLLCKIRQWTSSIGFILGASTLVGKMWLIYKDTTLAGRSASYTIRLYATIGISVLTDVICLVLLSTVFPLELRRITKGIETGAADRSHLVENFVTSCSYGDDVIPILISFTDMVVVLLLGVFLSYEVTQASFTQIEDSKPVSASIYNIILFGTCGLVLQFLLADDPVTADMFTSVLVITCTSITVLILLIPKILRGIRTGNPDNPTPGSLDKSSRSGGSGTSGMVGFRRQGEILGDLNEENERLKRKYEELLKLKFR